MILSFVLLAGILAELFLIPFTIQSYLDKKAAEDKALTQTCEKQLYRAINEWTMKNDKI